jgi:hypothetical protein
MEYPADKDTAREQALEASRQASAEGPDRSAPNIEAPGADGGPKIEAPGDRNPPEAPKPPKPEEVRRWEDEGGGVPDAPPPTTTR